MTGFLLFNHLNRQAIQMSLTLKSKYIIVMLNFNRKESSGLRDGTQSVLLQVIFCKCKCKDLHIQADIQ